MNSAKYFDFGIHRCRERIYSTAMFSLPGTKCTHSYRRLGLLLTRGWWRFSGDVGEAGVVWSPFLISLLATQQPYVMWSVCWWAPAWLAQSGNCKTRVQPPWAWALDSGSWFDFALLLHQEVKLSIAKEINVGACAQRGEEWFAWITEAV